jgi:hypothetical protein
MPNFVVFIIEIFKKLRLLIMVPIAIGTGSSPGEGAKPGGSWSVSFDWLGVFKGLLSRPFFMLNFIVFCG